MKFATKLTILLLVIIVVFGIGISFFVYTSNLKTLEEEVIDRLEDQAFHTMDKIDRTLYERYSDIQMMAIDPIISSRDSTPKEITERLVEYRNTYKTYTSLYFADLNRIKIADTLGIGIGKQHGITKYWEEVLQGKISAASDIYKSKSIKTVDIHFASPVKDENGDIFGAVIARMSITKLYEITKEAAGIHDEKEELKIDLIDKNGLLLYSNYNRKGILKDNLADWEAVKRSMQGEKIGSVKHTYPGEEETVYVFIHEQGHLDFKGNDWTLIIHIPTRAAFASAAELRNKLIRVILPIIALIVIFIFFFSKTITKPITKLKSSADKISKGHLGEPIEVKGKNEISELAESFDNMRYSLKMVIEEYEKMKGKEELLNKLTKETAEREEAQKELKESEEKLRTLFETMTDGFWAVGANGITSGANPSMAKMLGYKSKTKLINKNPADFIAKKDLATTGRLIKEAMAGKPATGEINLIKKDGKELPVSIVSSPIKDTTGKIIGAFAIMRDITEIKKKTEQLEKFVKFSSGREERILELKMKLKKLEKKLGK